MKAEYLDRLSLKILLLFCFLFLFTNKVEASYKASSLESSYLLKIENFLNGIKNLSSDFTQENNNGADAVGKFYISRPGKMRIEYRSNPKMLITVNGSVLTYKDLDLDEISNLSTNTTPASLLTRKNISFKAKDILIDSLKVNQNQVSVTVIKKNRPEAGKFRLIFNKEVTEFKKMEVIDDLGQVVTVKLSNVTYPGHLPSNLFYIKSSNLPF